MCHGDLLTTKEKQKTQKSSLSSSWLNSATIQKKFKKNCYIVSFHVISNANILSFSFTTCYVVITKASIIIGSVRVNRYRFRNVTVSYSSNNNFRMIGICYSINNTNSFKLFALEIFADVIVKSQFCSIAKMTTKQCTPLNLFKQLHIKYVVCMFLKPFSVLVLCIFILFSISMS